MNPWRRTRSELAGAWRSVQYDLGKRSGADESADDGGPVTDITSTGMSTFGGPFAGDVSAGYGDVPTGYVVGSEHRPPRRMVAVGVFGVLAIAGATGSYFAVVNGLGSLLAEKPAGAEPYPLAAAAPPAAEAASTAGLGRGTVRPAGQPAPPAVLVVPTTATSTVPRAAPVPAAAQTTVALPGRTTMPGTSVSPECDCMTPPVPTPTAPSATPSPSDSASASAEPSESEPAGPAESAEPTESAEGFVHSRRGRGY